MQYTVKFEDYLDGDLCFDTAVYEADSADEAIEMAKSDYRLGWIGGGSWSLPTYTIVEVN